MEILSYQSSWYPVKITTLVYTRCNYILHSPSSPDDVNNEGSDEKIAVSAVID